MISASLSPNTEFDDVWLAFRLLFTPWRWKRGQAAAKVEQKLGGVTFNSGRGAMLAILKAFGVGKGDEVLVQAFTCSAVPISVQWAGAIPVYVDIDDTYTMDIYDLEQKITGKTKAIIVQHTFGIEAHIDEIINIAKRRNIHVIEDFAHTMSLPVKGDAAFYSFGRDKVLSSVFGGLAVMKNSTALKKYHKVLEYPSGFWIFQQLMHPVMFAIILPFYRIGIGKVLLVILQRLRLLSYPEVSKVEKYPNALALLLLNQLKKLPRYTRTREEITTLYGGTGALLRFPMLVDDPKRVTNQAKKRGVLLGNWYHNGIDPKPVAYKKGSCPIAEEKARHIINLPTRISKKAAARVLSVL